MSPGASDASERAFLDTNVLVYLFDDDEPVKQARATELFERLVEEGMLLLSTQVLQEFYVVTTARLRSPLSPLDAATAVEAFARLPVVTVDPDIVLGAIGLAGRDSISLWDALIVRAAVAGGADVIYSEDLQHGRRIDRIRIEDPFGS